VKTEETPPSLAHKHYNAASAFKPENLLREARRQKKPPGSPRSRNLHSRSRWGHRSISMQRWILPPIRVGENVMSSCCAISHG